MRDIHVQRLPFGWTLVRTADFEFLEAESERRRQRNIAAAGEIAALEGKIKTLDAARIEDGRAMELSEVRRAEATRRAELAEGILRGQAKHIGALEASNKKLLDSVIEMRRVGFALPSDILNSPDPDVITTVADDDLQAVKTYPHLAAADED